MKHAAYKVISFENGQPYTTKYATSGDTLKDAVRRASSSVYGKPVKVFKRNAKDAWEFVTWCTRNMQFITEQQAAERLKA